ncbi:MAG: hypothetical protein ACOX6T_26560 [Myxococcales bacterium]|jgi:hypothetical protein
MKTLRRWSCAAAASLLLSGPALAQQQQQAQPQASGQPQGEQQGQTEQPGPIATGPGFRELQGNVAKVSRIGGNLTVVEPETGRLVTLEVYEKTPIVRGNQTVALENIREGTEVRAAYTVRGKELVAERIELSEKSPQAAEIVQERQGDQPAQLRIQGRVTERSRVFNSFKLVDPERDLAVNIEVVPKTTFTMNGRQATVDSLEPGQEVRATYELSNGRFFAREVEILRGPDLGAGQQGGQQPSQPQGSQQPSQPDQQQPSPGQPQ